MSGLAWDFPISQISGFSRETINMVMPVLILVLGVLLALLIIDGLTSSMLKVAAFVVNSRSGGISPMGGSDEATEEQIETEEQVEEADDDDEFD